MGKMNAIDFDIRTRWGIPQYRRPKIPQYIVEEEFSHLTRFMIQMETQFSHHAELYQPTPPNEQNKE